MNVEYNDELSRALWLPKEPAPQGASDSNALLGWLNWRNTMNDEQLIRVMASQPQYSDDANYAHMLRMGRAVEAVISAESDKWRARFEWLAEQHWFQLEAKFRLDLPDAELVHQFKRMLTVAVDTHLTPNDGIKRAALAAPLE